MIKVKDVFDFLNSKFPVTDACDFDNVGILVGDSDMEVKGVLVALDCTVNAVKKAEKIGANLIVTHHPVIFDGIKTVNEDSVVFELLTNNIAVISMHTNYDVGKGGLNDFLCEKLGLSDVKKFKADDGYLLNSAVSPISDPEELAENIKTTLGFSCRFVLGRPIKNVLVCSGSGGEFINDTLKYGFDALITADVKHNQFVTALNHNITLIDAGHFATENICVDAFSSLIKSRFNGLNVQKFDDMKIKFN